MKVKKTRLRQAPRIPSEELRILYNLAKKVRKNAYCPYSEFAVGSAILDEKGQIHVGCNYENSSFGGTICAERNAIGTMVALGGKEISQVVVVTDTEKGTTPCGLCRQVLVEFCSKLDKTLVHVANTKGVIRTYTVAELAPYQFSRNDLKKKKKTSS